jgi:hypothetical protein
MAYQTPMTDYHDGAANGILASQARTLVNFGLRTGLREHSHRRRNLHAAIRGRIAQSAEEGTMGIVKRHRLATVAGGAFLLGVSAALAIVFAMASGNGCSGAKCGAQAQAQAASRSGAPAAAVNDATATPDTGTTAATNAVSTTSQPPVASVVAPAAAGSGHAQQASVAPAVSANTPATSAAQGAPSSAPPAAPPPAAPRAGAAVSSALSNFDTQVCPAAIDGFGHSQCGADIHFCDTWVGGFCNDYRTKQTTDAVAFPQPGDAVSLDCLSSTNAGQTDALPYYVPTNNTDNTDVAGSQIIPFPCGISFREHFMTRMEDGQFGMVVMRQQHPFDFAGRTGHIHFDVDLKTQERRYPRLVLSPQLTKTAVDDRNNVPATAQSFEIWFRNGTFQGKMSKGGQLVDLFPSCNGCGPRYYGSDNTRDSVDVYISRTHVKIVVNGNTEVDTDIPDIGFDQAYVYLDHLNYNSCKAYAQEGYATVAECQVDGNMFHWDNVAFDGPTLPINSLTPAGSEDVVFNAWSAASCTVKGVQAQGSGLDYVWQTWVARLPAGTPVAAADVKCDGGGNGGFHWYRGAPMGLEIVHQ